MQRLIKRLRKSTYSLEVFIDENNHKSDSYEDDDKQYRINYENAQSFSGPNCNEENVVSAAVVTDKGYLIEAAFKWTEIAPAVGDTIGVELQINDAEGGKRIGTVSWYDESGQGWSSPGVFGTATLGGLIEVEREGLWALEIADVTYTGKALKPPVTVYDGKTLLTLGRDYTVSYKKNTKPTDQAEAVEYVLETLQRTLKLYRRISQTKIFSFRISMSRHPRQAKA